MEPHRKQFDQGQEMYEYVLTNWWSEEEMTLSRRLKTTPPVAVVPSHLADVIAIAQPIPALSRLDNLILGVCAAFARIMNRDLANLYRRGV